MNYDWLFSFVVFAEHLNFTRTAEELHISQPALFVQIRKLAEGIGKPLYVHRGRSLVLTREGEQLAAFGREVRDRGQAVLEQVRGLSISRPITLASGQGAFLYLLGPAIQRYTKRSLPLRLLTMHGPAIIDAVREARAHVGVAALETVPSDLEAITLKSVGQIAVVPRSHRLSRKVRITPEDLSGESLIVPTAGSPHRTMLTNALAAVGATWKVGVEASGWELMVHFAQYGLGIAIVNDFVTVPRGMVGVPVAGVPPVNYYLLRREAPSGREVQMLFDFVRQSIAGKN